MVQGNEIPDSAERRTPNAERRQPRFPNAVLGTVPAEGLQGALTTAKSTNLRVWQQARGLLKNISLITADMPAEGDLTSQLRRAISVVSDISEGAERSDRDGCRLFAIALGSNAEVETQIIIAGDLGLLDSATVNQITEQTDHIGRMLRRLIQHRRASG
jgi:four helix bundle protein